MVLMVLASAAAVQTANAQLLTGRYEDSQNGYSFEIPSGWEALDYGETVMATPSTIVTTPAENALFMSASIVSPAHKFASAAECDISARYISRDGMVLKETEVECPPSPFEAQEEFKNLAVELNTVSRQYHYEEGKWRWENEYTNEQMVAIIDQFIPKYQDGIDRLAELEISPVHQEAKDLALKSFQAELDSHRHFRNYLLTGDEEEKERSDALLQDSFEYSIQHDDVAAATRLYSIQLDQSPVRVKEYLLGLDDERLLLIRMVATTYSQFERYLPEFEQAVSTLSVQSWIDVREAERNALGLNQHVRTVNVGEEEKTIDIFTSSTITDFRVDEEMKAVSFTVDGPDDTEGTTMLAISRVLEGPYVVTIDGTEVGKENLQVVYDDVDGEIVISVSYSPSVHEILISGTRVVPEFPIPVIAALAAAIGVVAALGRFRPEFRM